MAFVLFSPSLPAEEYNVPEGQEMVVDGVSLDEIIKLGPGSLVLKNTVTVGYFEIEEGEVRVEGELQVPDDMGNGVFVWNPGRLVFENVSFAPSFPALTGDGEVVVAANEVELGSGAPFSGGDFYGRMLGIGPDLVVKVRGNVFTPTFLRAKAVEVSDLGGSFGVESELTIDASLPPIDVQLGPDTTLQTAPHPAETHIGRLLGVGSCQLQGNLVVDQITLGPSSDPTAYSGFFDTSYPGALILGRGAGFEATHPLAPSTGNLPPYLSVEEGTLEWEVGVSPWQTCIVLGSDVSEASISIIGEGEVFVGAIKTRGKGGVVQLNGNDLRIMGIVSETLPVATPPEWNLLRHEGPGKIIVGQVVDLNFPLLGVDSLGTGVSAVDEVMVDTNGTLRMTGEHPDTVLILEPGSTLKLEGDIAVKEIRDEGATILNSPPFNLGLAGETSPANSPTTDITLSNASVAENEPIGTFVGEFNATDPDANATHVFSLTDGNGSTDNGLFTIDANGTLRTAESFDYETNASTYSIRVQTKDEFNATVEGVFTVMLNNVLEDLDGDGIEDHYDPDDDGDGFSDEVELAYPSDPRDSNSVANLPPADLNSTAPLTIAENQPVGTVVGQFSATDPDGDAITYHLVGRWRRTPPPTMNIPFTLETNGTLRTAIIFDYESSAPTFSFTIHAKDEHNASVEGIFLVTLENLNESPTIVNKPDFIYHEIEKYSDALSLGSWQNRFEFAPVDVARSALSLENADYLLSGNTVSSELGNTDFVSFKVDETGNQLWSKSFGGFGNDSLVDSMELSGPGYLLAGNSDSNESGDKSQASFGGSDYWIVCLDENGSKLWDHAYGGAGVDEIAQILPTANNGFLLAGSSDSNRSGVKTNDSFGQNDFWLVKVDHDGNKLWDKTFGNAGDDVLHGAIALRDGGFILAGISEPSGLSADSSQGPEERQFLVMKVDELGELLWEKTYDYGNAITVHNLIPCPDDGYYLLGNYQNESNESIDTIDFVSKFDSVGKEEWLYLVDESSSAPTDALKLSAKSADNGLLLLFSDQLIKLDENGTESWSNILPSVASNSSLTEFSTPTTETGTEVAEYRSRGSAALAGTDPPPDATNQTAAMARPESDYADEVTNNGNSSGSSAGGGLPPKPATPTVTGSPSSKPSAAAMNTNSGYSSTLSLTGSDFIQSKNGGFLLLESWHQISRSPTSDNSGRAGGGSAVVQQNAFVTRSLDARGNYAPFEADDPEDDELIWSVKSNPANGIASVYGFSDSQPKITYEPNPSFVGLDSFVIQVRDEQFTDVVEVRVKVFDTNELPADLNSTAPLTIAENQPVGTVVGQFSATDPDGDAITYHLVTGSGDGSNAFFSLESNGTLKTAEIFDYETKPNHSIRVRATDERNASLEKVFAIQVLPSPDGGISPPEVLHLTAKQRPGTKLVDVSYDLEWDANETLSVEIWFAGDDDFVFDVPCYTVSGDVGSGIAAGNGKSIVWDAGVDWDDSYSPRGRIKLILTYGDGQQASSGGP